MRKIATVCLCVGLSSGPLLAKGPARDIPYEVQLRICAENPADSPSWDELRQRFGLDGSELQIFSTWFLETPALDLNRKGLTLRLREAVSSSDKTEYVVKSWVPDARAVRESWWALDGFKCESNFYPGPLVNDQCNLKTKTRLPRRISELTTSQVLKGFSSDQRELLGDLGEMRTLPSTIRVLGPLRSVKIEGSIEVDQWILPDGSRDTEISSKTLRAPEATLHVLRERLEGSGFVVCPEQGGRTRRALETLLKQSLKSY